MMCAKLFAPTAGSSLLIFTLLLAVHSFANAADVTSAVSTDVSSAIQRRLASNCGNGDDIAFVQERVKCPGSARSFRTNDNAPLSKEECAQMCENDPECNFFSLGVRGVSNWRGVCIGCPAAADGKFMTEYSFDTFEVCRTAAPTSPPTTHPTTSAPTLAPITQFPTYPAGTCFNLRFQTGSPASHSKKGDGGQFHIEGYGNLPGNCHYGRWGGCDIELCGLPNDELKITAIKSRTWNFDITGDIGPLIGYETWDGTGTHFAPFPTWLGGGKDKSQTYRLLKAPTTAPTSLPTLAPTTAPTSLPTLAPTTAPTLAPTTPPTLNPTSALTAAPVQPGQSVNHGDIINLKNNFMDARWLTGARTNGNDEVFTKDPNSAAHGDPNYEQDRISTYQWTIQMDPTNNGLGCVEYGMPIYLKNNNPKPDSGRWLTGGRTNDNEEVFTRDYFIASETGPSYAWTFQRSADYSGSGCVQSYDIVYLKLNSMDGRWLTGSRSGGNELVETRDYNNPSNNYYEQSVGATYQWIVQLDNPPTSAPTLAPTAAPTPGGACYDLEETYYASEANWCYKVETGKGSNDFFARHGSNDCKARFNEASASEWYVGNAAFGQYHYTEGANCGGKPREGTVTIIEEARTDIVGTATSAKNEDGVCFYEITIRRPPCHTSVPTIAPTVAATPAITASRGNTASQGNTRTISAQGDPIILGLKGQVFKFDGRDGGWYANIASKSFNWNMQFKEYPTCKEGSDVFISGMSLLTSKESDRQHQTSESNILIATTPYQIEECRGHDKNCLGDGTLHISFDGGKSYVSNPGDYHYASRNRVVAHNTYGACSRRWYDYNITPKQSKFSRLGGRRVTVEEKKPFELLTEKAETMINPGECLEWIEERKNKNDLFEQKGLWSTVHVQTPSVAFHIEYRQSNPEKSDKECDFQSLDAWMVTVSKDLEEQTWEGILGETKENIYDVAGHQIMSDRNVLLRGKEDADYEVDGPFGTTFNAQKKTSILPW